MDYQGVLKKKSPKSFLGISIWQDRLFVIGDKSIKYFKTDSSSSKLENASAGEITMDSIVLVKGRHRSVEFQIHCNTDRVYELAAQSIAEAQGWLSALSLCYNSLGPLHVEGLNAQEASAIRKKNKKSNEKPLSAEIIEPKVEVVHVTDRLCFSVTVEFTNTSTDRDLIFHPFVALFGQKKELVVTPRVAIFDRAQSSERYTVTTRAAANTLSSSLPDRIISPVTRSNGFTISRSVRNSTRPNTFDDKLSSVLEEDFKIPVSEEKPHARFDSSSISGESKWVHICSTETVAMQFPSRKSVDSYNKEPNGSSLVNHNQTPLLFKIILALPIKPVTELDSRDEVTIIIQDNTGRRSYSEQVSIVDLFSTKMLRLGLYNTSRFGSNNSLGGDLMAVADICVKDLRLFDQLGILSLSAGHDSISQWNMLDGRNKDVFKGQVRLTLLQVHRAPLCNTDRFIYKSYVLASESAVNVVHETLVEPPNVFSMPLFMLKASCSFHSIHAKLLMERVEDIDTFLRSKPQLSSAVQSLIASGVEEDPYEIDKEKRAKLLDLHENSLEYVAKIKTMIDLFSGYRGQYRGLHFKPSAMKSNSWLGFVPINLHMQTLLISNYPYAKLSKKLLDHISVDYNTFIPFSISSNERASIDIPTSSSIPEEDENAISDSSSEEDIATTTDKIRRLSVQTKEVTPSVRPSIIFSSPPNQFLAPKNALYTDYNSILISKQEENSTLLTETRLRKKSSLNSDKTSVSSDHISNSSPVITSESSTFLSPSSLPLDSMKLRKKSSTRSKSDVSSNLDILIPVEVSTVPIDTVTVGAHSAHAYKYKPGGVTSSMTAHDKQLKQFPAETDALLGNVEHFQQTLQFRKECCFSQSLTSVVFAFVQSILRNISRPDILERYATCGYLYHFESLLSTFGDELAMLSDLNYSVYFLKNIHFCLRKTPAGCTYDEFTDSFVRKSNANSSSASSILNESMCNSFPCSSWTLGGTPQTTSHSSVDSYVPFLSDIHTHVAVPIIRPINITDFNILHNSHERGAVASVKYVTRKRDATLDSVDTPASDHRFCVFPPALIVDVFLPLQMWTLLPSSLVHPADVNTGSVSSPNNASTFLAEPLIQVVPILFSQGINEMQTIANASGSDLDQYDINVYYVELLKGYIRHLDDPNSDVVNFKAKITEDINKLELLIHKTRGEKSVELIALADSITRRLHGGRAVGCKSAKDRTSMSVTWHSARSIFGPNKNESNYQNATFQSFLETMRVEGVRRQNVLKNAGKPLFAFNTIQRSMLPVEFQAPEYCCGSVQRKVYYFSIFMFVCFGPSSFSIPFRSSFHETQFMIWRRSQLLQRSFYVLVILMLTSFLGFLNYNTIIINGQMEAIICLNVITAITIITIGIRNYVWRLDWWFQPNVRTRFTLLYFALLVGYGGMLMMAQNDKDGPWFSLPFVVYLLIASTSFKMMFLEVISLVATLITVLLIFYGWLYASSKMHLSIFVSDIISYVTIAFAGLTGAYFAEITSRSNFWSLMVSFQKQSALFAFVELFHSVRIKREHLLSVADSCTVSKVNCIPLSINVSPLLRLENIPEINTPGTPNGTPSPMDSNSPSVRSSGRLVRILSIRSPERHSSFSGRFSPSFLSNKTSPTLGFSSGSCSPILGFDAVLTNSEENLVKLNNQIVPFLKNHESIEESSLAHTSNFEKRLASTSYFEQIRRSGKIAPESFLNTAQSSISKNAGSFKVGNSNDSLLTPDKVLLFSSTKPVLAGKIVSVNVNLAKKERLDRLQNVFRQLNFRRRILAFETSLILDLEPIFFSFNEIELEVKYSLSHLNSNSKRVKWLMAGFILAMIFGGFQDWQISKIDEFWPFLFVSRYCVMIPILLTCLTIVFCTESCKIQQFGIGICLTLVGTIYSVQIYLFPIIDQNLLGSLLRLQFIMMTAFQLHYKFAVLFQCLLVLIFLVISLLFHFMHDRSITSNIIFVFLVGLISSFILRAIEFEWKLRYFINPDNYMINEDGDAQLVD